MTEIQLTELATKVVEKLNNENKTLGLAESCTGGLVAKTITDVSGCSSGFLGGGISYADEALRQM